MAIEFPAELALVYVSYYNAESTLKKELNVKLKAISERQSQQISDYFDNQIHVVAALSQIPDFANLVQSAIEAPADRSTTEISPKQIRALAKYKQIFRISNFFVFSAHYRLIFSTDDYFKSGSDLTHSTLINTELANVTERAGILLQAQSSDFTFIAGRNYPSAFISSPIQAENGRFLGILVVEISNAEIAKVVNDYTGLGKTGESLILSAIEGKTIATTPTRFRKLTRAEYLIGEKNPIPIGNALQGEFGSGFYTDYRQKKVFAYWTYIPALRSALVVKIDHEEAFIPIQNLRWILIMVVLATLAVVVIAAFSAANFFTNPIRKLTLRPVD
ncbi:MAG: hypothetical protein HC880_04100 [Bacteroidia bacterium]|nr:hypothetical protein [Bacteroidia bacterium]